MLDKDTQSTGTCSNGTGQQVERQTREGNERSASELRGLGFQGFRVLGVQGFGVLGFRV